MLVKPRENTLEGINSFGGDFSEEDDEDEGAVVI
jgi:hypothetical protein